MPACRATCAHRANYGVTAGGKKDCWDLSFSEQRCSSIMLLHCCTVDTHLGWGTLLGTMRRRGRSRQPRIRGPSLVLACFHAATARLLLLTTVPKQSMHKISTTAF